VILNLDKILTINKLKYFFTGGYVNLLKKWVIKLVIQ